MCYKKNYLSKVILRADFSHRPIGALTEKSPIAELITDKFPHVSSNPLVEMTFNMTQEGGGIGQKPLGSQWRHSKTAGGTVAATLAPTFLALEYGFGDFTKFDDFYAEFSFLLESLAKTCDVTEVERIGLRYVNEIRLAGNALDWDDVLSKNIVAVIKTPVIPDGRLLRSMHQVSELHGDDQVLLTYGLVNPDFPAPVVQRFFVLDVDCSRQGLVLIADALGRIKRLNELATEAFENAIDEGLRKIMGVI